MVSQPLLRLVPVPMRFEMCEHALKVIVRKLGVAIEAEEIRLPGEGFGRALFSEKIEEALHPSKTLLRFQKFPCGAGMRTKEKRGLWPGALQRFLQPARPRMTGSQSAVRPRARSAQKGRV